jgi:3-hydroxyisobutyrate dehydrogenase
MAQIGFIGLGNMGLPMAQNLLKAGHTVAGFDVSQARVEQFTAAGGKAAASIATAAAGVEIIISMLPAGKQVREVYLADNGVLAVAGPGTLLIDSSTIDVETARAVAAVAAHRRQRSLLWSAAAWLRSLAPSRSSKPWARPSCMPAVPATARPPRSATT